MSANSWKWSKYESLKIWTIHPITKLTIHPIKKPNQKKKRKPNIPKPVLANFNPTKFSGSVKLSNFWGCALDSCGLLAELMTSVEKAVTRDWWPRENGNTCWNHHKIFEVFSYDTHTLILCYFHWLCCNEGKMKKSYLTYTLEDNKSAISENTFLKHFECYV